MTKFMSWLRDRFTWRSVLAIVAVLTVICSAMYVPAVLSENLHAPTYVCIITSIVSAIVITMTIISSVATLSTKPGLQLFSKTVRLDLLVVDAVIVLLAAGFMIGLGYWLVGLLWLTICGVAAHAWIMHCNCIQKLTERCEHAEQLAENYKHERDVALAEKNTIGNTLTNLRASYESLHSSHADTKNELEKALAAIELERAEHENTRKALQAANERLQSVNAKLKAEADSRQKMIVQIDEAGKALDNANAAVATQKSAYDRLKAEHDKLIAQLDSSDKAKMDAEAQVHSVNAKLTKRSAELEVAEAKLAELTDELEQAKLELGTAKTEHDNDMTALADAKLAIDALKGELATALEKAAKPAKTAKTASKKTTKSKTSKSPKTAKTENDA